MNELLRSFGYRREESVYIGDSDVDIMTAENAGVDCISVDWGFRSRDFLRKSGAAAIASNSLQLYSFITGEHKDHSKIAGDLFLKDIIAVSLFSLLLMI